MMLTRDFLTESRRRERRALLEMTRKRKPKKTAKRRSDVVYLGDKR